MAKKDMIKDGVKAFGIGALKQINLVNYAAGAGGSIIGMAIRGEEITPKKVFAKTSNAVLAVSTISGVANVILNKDIIKRREEVRKQGIDPGSIV